MHIYYRLMTRQNYQTTVGKRSITPPPPRHSKRVSAAPESILNYLSYWREDKLLDELSNWKEDCRDDPLEPGATVFFSMPPSFRYTVKATGEQFRSHEEDHYKAYVEYLRSKL